MAVIVNLTTFPGADETELAASDAGWSRSTTPPFGTLALVLDGAARIKPVLTSGHTTGYLRTETPGSKNQTVRAVINFTAKVSDNYPVLLARVSGNNWIGAYAVGSANTLHLAKSVAGVRTSAATTPFTFTAGVNYEITLEVSGSAPAIAARVLVDGTEVLTRAYTEAALDVVGSVGLHHRAGSSGGGVRILSFYAEDDTGGPVSDPPQGTVTISSVTPDTTTASVAYSYDDTDQTGFEYRIDGGAAASIGASPATITGLTASTEYDIEIRAINGDGAGAWSSASTFTTSASGDEELPTLTGTITISALTTTSYTATWPAGSDNVAVTGYEYRIAAGSWVDRGNNLSVDITGRTPGATESFEVRAYDAAGNRSTPAISDSVTLLSASTDGTITVGSALYPIKYSSASVLNESGLRAAVLDATTLAEVLNTSGVVCNAGVITITDAAIVIGNTYHLVVKTANGWTGCSDVVTAS